MFIFPLYVVLYFKERNSQYIILFIIPIVSTITCILALLFGRPLNKLWGIYFGQIGETQDLVYNLFPNNP